jgi:putative lipoprotein
VFKVLATLALMHAPPQSPPEKWFGVDKVKHFMMSAFIHSAAFSAARAAGLPRSSAQVAGSVSSLAVGVAKELRDRRRARQFSVKDLLWDGAGALSAAALLNGTR